MLLGFDLNHLFFFPVESAQARKRFMIGALLIFASFIIPIVPYLLVMGYTMKIMRQVMNGQKPSMPDWDDWETMLKDGLQLFGIRLVYTLPIILIMLPFFGLFFLAPFIASSGSEGEAIFAVIMFVFSMLMLCLMPVFIIIGILFPAIEAHVTAQGEFSAGFRVQEWWNIFRKNLGGFVIAFMIMYGISMVASFALQIMIFTVILLCLLPILLPMFSMYLQLIYYTIIAQAYGEGRLRLSAPAEAT